MTIEIDLYNETLNLFEIIFYGLCDKAFDKN